MKFRIVLLTLFALINLVSPCAQHLISGKITAKDKAPLVGVNITIKGTYDGTISDTNGE